jgi:hypothetical protein
MAESQQLLRIEEPLFGGDLEILQQLLAVSDALDQLHCAARAHHSRVTLSSGIVSPSGTARRARFGAARGGPIRASAQ